MKSQFQRSMERNKLESAGQERKRNNEIIFYVLAFVVAAGLRFIKLGELPLSGGEANLALQALDAVKGIDTSVSSQPGYIALTALLFSIFSATGFWACFWPALAGSVIVFIPFLFKELLGSRCSILLAFLFAIDAGLVAVSRSASGTMITIVGLLAAIGFLYKKRSLWAGICAGFFILGGFASCPALIAMGIVALLLLLIYSKNKPQTRLLDGINGKQFFSAFIAAIFFIGTGFILFPSIINGLGTGIHDYFTTFVSHDGVSIKLILISLPISEVLTLPLAIWGLVIGIKRREKFSYILGYSIIILALLSLLNPSRQVADWVWPIIPLTILAAIGLENIFEKFTSNEIGVTSVQAVLTVILIVFSFLNLLSMMNNPPVDAPTLRISIIEVALPLAFLIVVTLLMAFGWSMAAARQGLLVGFGFVLLFVTFSTSIKAAGLGPRPEMEFWHSGAVPTGSALLVKTTTELSLYSTGTENRIDIVIVDADSSELRWSLHNYENLKTIEYIGETDKPAIIISDLDSLIGSAASYRGQEIHWTTQVDYDNMSASDWLMWFTIRQAPTIEQSLLIWARNDLFAGS